jgi:hypothetical protein
MSDKRPPRPTSSAATSRAASSNEIADDALVARALLAVEPSVPGDDLADRAFRAALSGPPPSMWATLVEEIASLSRLFAGGAVAVALVLVVVAPQAPAATRSTFTVTAAVYTTARSDVWVTAALPFDPTALSTREVSP